MQKNEAMYNNDIQKQKKNRNESFKFNEDIQKKK